MKYFSFIVSIIFSVGCSDTSNTISVSDSSARVNADTASVDTKVESTKTLTQQWWENLPVKDVAQLILSDSIRPQSSKVTFQMLDSLSASSHQSRNYYFGVFNKIMGKADGALAESIGSYALTFVQNYPGEFIEHTKSMSKNSIEAWASNIGIELFLASNGNENAKEAHEQIAVLMNDNCKNCNADVQRRLKEFNLLVRTTIDENADAGQR